MENKVFNTGETLEELRIQYNPEGSDMRKAQMRMLEMLKYIDSVCEEQNIDYQLNSGCVIGMVRHGGFIPWDDDIDLMLPRKDYERLCRYMKEHPHPQFVLQDHTTDPRHYFLWSAVRDLKSEYMIDSEEHKAKKYRGLQVDLFPYDRGSFFWLHKQAIHIFNWLVTRPNRNLLWTISNIGYFIATKLLMPLFRQLSLIFGNKNIWSHAYGVPWHKQYPADVLFPSKSVMFEGIEVMGPAKPEEYCKISYGENYTDLPAKEHRNPHQAVCKIWN